MGLNWITPYIGDDYPLSFIFGTTQRLSSLSDIFTSSYNEYMIYGGRSIAYFITQVFLLIGEKYIFNIMNTVIYYLFIYLVYFHVKGTIKNIKFSYFIIINIMFWFLVPAWGEVFLWIIGSCVYLWTTTFILLFLIPYKKKCDDPKYRINTILSFLFLPVGIFAGWSVENSGAAGLFFLILYFILKVNKKERVSLFEILGCIGFIIGFVFLIAAPGNYGRMDITRINNQNEMFIIFIIKNFLRASKKILSNEIYFLASLLILLGFDLIFHIKNKLNSFTWCCLIAGLAGIYSMILSPIFGMRTCFITVVFFVIALLSIFEQIREKIPEITKRNKNIIFLLVIIGSGSSLISASQQIWDIHLLWKERRQYISLQKEMGNFDIKLEIYNAYFRDKHAVLYECPDVTKDPTSLLNKTMAAYYGVKTISGVEGRNLMNGD
jgi:hypothetical protein